MTKNIQEVVIIGSGPAGFTAAIYAARAGLKPILYEGRQPGGQLTITSDVENYPGYPQGVLGPDMMKDFKEQAQRFGTKVISSVVTKVDICKYPFELEIDTKAKIYSKSIIISTGASAKWLNIESEKRLYGKGVSACAVCDGYFYKNQIVAVVGGGDTAAEESLYLSSICKKVYVLIRKNYMKASLIMQKRLKERQNIEILFNTETVDVLGESEVEGVEIINNKTNKKQKIMIKGFFVAIGHTPNSKLFKQQLEMDKEGYIVTKDKTTTTNVEGIFACGDVQDKIYRQAVTAAGSGCMAALDAERFLNTKSQKNYNQ